MATTQKVGGGLNSCVLNSFSTSPSWNALDFQRLPSERKTKHVSLKDLFSDNRKPVWRGTRPEFSGPSRKEVTTRPPHLHFFSSRRGQSIPNGGETRTTPKNDFDFVLSLASVTSSASDLSIEHHSKATSKNWRKKKGEQESIVSTSSSISFPSFAALEEQNAIFESDSESAFSSNESDEEDDEMDNDSNSESENQASSVENVFLLRLLTETELKELEMDLSQWDVNLNAIVNKNKSQAPAKENCFLGRETCNLLEQKQHVPQSQEGVETKCDEQVYITAKVPFGKEDDIKMMKLPLPFKQPRLINDKSSILPPLLASCSFSPSSLPIAEWPPANLKEENQEKKKQEISEVWPKSKIFALQRLLLTEKAEVEKVENLVAFKKWLRKCCGDKVKRTKQTNPLRPQVSKETECRCSTISHRSSFLLLCFSSSSILCGGFDLVSEKYCCVESCFLDLDKPPKCFVETLKCHKITKFYVETQKEQEMENIKKKKKLIFNPHVLIYNFMDVLQKLEHWEKKKAKPQVPKVSDFLVIWNLGQMSKVKSFSSSLLLALHFLMAYSNKLSYCSWKNLTLRKTEENLEIRALLSGLALL